MKSVVLFVSFVLAVTACSRGWDGKDGFRLCQPAITAGKPPPTCAAMSMCANEATLDASERAKLDAMMRAASCPPP